MDGKKKRQYRDIAELIRTYGWPPERVLAGWITHARSGEPEPEPEPDGESATASATVAPADSPDPDKAGSELEADAHVLAELEYGLWLNRHRAVAVDAAGTMRAIRAALSPRPYPLLIDAATEVGGNRVLRQANEQTLAAMEAESVEKWAARFGRDGDGGEG